MAEVMLTYHHETLGAQQRPRAITLNSIEKQISTTVGTSQGIDFVWKQFVIMQMRGNDSGSSLSGQARLPRHKINRTHLGYQSSCVQPSNQLRQKVPLALPTMSLSAWGLRVVWSQSRPRYHHARPSKSLLPRNEGERSYLRLSPRHQDSRFGRQILEGRCVFHPLVQALFGLS